MGFSAKFLPELFKDGENPRSLSEIDANLQSMIDGTWPFQKRWVNSGVMKVSGRCLSTDFREDLLEIAKHRTFSAEQSYLTTLFDENPDYKTQMLSSKYNFTSGAFARASAPKQASMLGDIVFLHYTAGKKPWAWPVGPQSPLPNILWRRVEAEAARESEIIDRPRHWLAARTAKLKRR